MSCVVGVVQNGCVWMGGDSAATDAGGLQTVCANPKVFRRENYLVGAVGTWRLIQLLRYENLGPLDPANPDISVEVWADDFAEMCRVKALLNAEGEIRDEAMVMLGFAHKLYVVQKDFGVIVSQRGYDAIGTMATESVALGNLWATEGIAGEDRVRLALEASAEFCATVRPPFVIETL